MNFELKASLTATEYARLRGKSKAWVSAQIEQGMPVLSGGGSGREYAIDPGAAVRWELSRARERMQAQSASERLCAARAEAVERQNRQRAAELVQASIADQVVRSVAETINAQLDALPGRVENDIARTTSPAEIRALLLRETRLIRTAVAARLNDLSGAA